MQIDFIACPGDVEEKLAQKHHLTLSEARQTFNGRYLSVFFIFNPGNHTAIIISARDMSQKERKSYARK